VQVTASGPPLPVLMAALAALRDQRLGAARADELARLRGLAA